MYIFRTNYINYKLYWNNTDKHSSLSVENVIINNDIIIRLSSLSLYSTTTVLLGEAGQKQ